MRIWSVHPRYLDARGLVALWREGLLALKVLQGGTRGYRHHPQLARFRAESEPVAVIGSYLRAVHAEAARRGYRFDEAKLPEAEWSTRIALPEGQLRYEWGHLLRKLEVRDPDRYARDGKIEVPEPHPLFTLVPGGIAAWERT